MATNDDVLSSNGQDPERLRLTEAHESGVPWLRWGPYLSDRQWGTVREDYSASGDAWSSFPHDHARSRAYRWGEDGLLGVSDDQGLLCFALRRGRAALDRGGLADRAIAQTISARAHDH